MKTLNILQASGKGCKKLTRRPVLAWQNEAGRNLAERGEDKPAKMRARMGQD
jgi:hypothetical protein